MTSVEEVQSILQESCRLTLIEAGFQGEKLEDATAILVQQAYESYSIREKFQFAVSDKASVSKGKGEVNLVRSTLHTNDIIPSLTAPSVVRKKCRKFRLTIDHYMAPNTVELFNVHYGKSADMEFTHTLYHDHPEAAASRKIETEVVMTMLRARGADLTRTPSNGYDASVIDVGGDWRYHHVRSQFGVHVDAPFLDARDASRDARKRLQLQKGADNSQYVCRNMMQHCNLTAPFMMAVHSVLYTMPIVDICQAMAKRGTSYFIGTMQLPQELETMYTSYVDPHYGYVIEYVAKDVQAAGKYLPPQVRAGVGKYLFDSSKERMRYRYPSGESREYVHDRDILLEKLHAGTYFVTTMEGTNQTYRYRIVKRVGSLVYASIELEVGDAPAHRVQMVSRVSPYSDSYCISVDANLLSDFFITTFRATEVIVPRQLFTAIAAHCLEKTQDDSFTIEGAISYGYSAAAQYEANGVILHKATVELGRNVCVVTAAIAAFFWAFDRKRLLERRLPHVTISEQQLSLANRSSSRLTDAVAWKSLYATAKSYVAQGAADLVVEKLVSMGTTYADVSRLYTKLVSLMSPGIHFIRDMAVNYPTLQMMNQYSPTAARYYASRVVHAFPACQPHYELEPARRLDMLRSHSQMIVEGRMSEAATLVESFSTQPVGNMSQVNDFTKIALDAINLAEAAQSEREQTARAIYAQVFDQQTRDIRDAEMLKGLVKGRPTLIYYANNVIFKVVTLDAQYMKGQQSYDRFMASLAYSRCIFPERVDGKIQYGTCVIQPSGALESDRRFTMRDQSFTALLSPDLRIQNAHRLRLLRKELQENPIDKYPIATLANECAGSGKTHDQCVRYKNAQLAGKSAAIFASTRAAANQAISRLKDWKCDIVDSSISTVDSFLMNDKAWRHYDEVYIDEALQLHAGKILCIAYLTTPSILRGYGDRKQIGFLPFTRFYKPGTDTTFHWATEERNLCTRRIPNDSLIVNWLRQDSIYGTEFVSVSRRTQAVVLMARFAAFEERLTVRSLYNLLGIPLHEELMILVFLQDEAMRLRSKLDLTRDMKKPELGDDGQLMPVVAPACVCTIGESQGEDVDNVVVIRLSSKAEPLHQDIAQTTVALTRHKKRWAFLTVQSQFPSLIEQYAGSIDTYATFESAKMARNNIVD